ncbi:hypothetical protein GCM10010430_55700 [Kitasatospora cystarginea]|uniref:Uncharacterized protein n=1 Tax=Kitasatospora cystarginea TaxID=58350 RepID=A0ABN3EPA3_9ACTN
MVALVESFLRTRVSARPDLQPVQVAVMVRKMTDDHSLLRVDQATARFKLAPRPSARGGAAHQQR